MEYRGRVGTASRHSFIQGRGATASRPWGAGADAYADASLPNKVIPPPEPGSRPFGSLPFSHQPPEAGCQLPLVLVPSGPRVLELCPQPTIRFPSAAPLSAVSSPCQRVNLPTCQLVIRSVPPSLRASRVLPLVPVSPCPRAPSRKRALSRKRSAAYAIIPFTTFAGSTPVSLKSRPW